MKEIEGLYEDTQGYPQTTLLMRYLIGVYRTRQKMPLDAVSRLP